MKTHKEFQEILTKEYDELTELEKQYRYHHDNRKKCLKSKCDEAIKLESERCRFIAKQVKDQFEDILTIANQKRELYGCDFIICPDEH